MSRTRRLRRPGPSIEAERDHRREGPPARCSKTKRSCGTTVSGRSPGPTTAGPPPCPARSGGSPVQRRQPKKQSTRSSTGRWLAWVRCMPHSGARSRGMVIPNSSRASRPRPRTPTRGLDVTGRGTRPVVVHVAGALSQLEQDLDAAGVAEHDSRRRGRHGSVRSPAEPTPWGPRLGSQGARGRQRLSAPAGAGGCCCLQGGCRAGPPAADLPRVRKPARGRGA